MNISRIRVPYFLPVTAVFLAGAALAADSGRFAHSDSDARYVHWIDLYDTANRKITETSTLPYSPQNTCGRCHDYDAISHGWHFNAFAVASDQNGGQQAGHEQGRPSEPWIWTDARTGTQLPLSYRSQPESATSVFDPRAIGLSAWQVTSQFGARFSGGGFGEPATKNVSEAKDAEPDSVNAASPRWSFAGSLEIDCMVCHASSGQYDFESRRSQITDENFAWAPTAALHLASIDGKVSRIKDDADPKDEKATEALPKLSYDAKRFASDGKVFFDLVREPDNNACYQCHSTLQVSGEGIEPSWTHDEDVHLRAGMLCVDCHRNGIEHHTVRGFEGEVHPAGESVATLSCRGCHLGTDSTSPDVASDAITARAGRLGSPKPMHAGLPPVHFERLSCTACHAGPAPRGEAIRMLTSLAHSLGASEHRSGQEAPQIQGPIYAKLADGKIYPQRVMWPAYWGTLDGDSIKPLSPSNVYDWTRKTLRVRKDFVEEIASDQKKFDEKVSASLAAIEQESGAKQAVYVSTGQAFARVTDDSGKTSLQALTNKFDATQMVTWPIAHSVRPAGWSLGVGGCLECHSDGGKIFDSTVTPLGPAPLVAGPIAMASLQGIDANQRLLWNQLFGGRANFKVMVAVSLAIVLAVLFVGLGSVATMLTRRQSIVVEKKS